MWELVDLFAPCPLEPRSTPTHTGGAPVPLFKNPKASGFWYNSTNGKDSLQTIIIDRTAPKDLTGYKGAIIKDGF